MPDSPAVSIVVPAYNQAQFLNEAIDSVLAQDYPNIELIVLNDGSSDETEAVLKQYRPGRFQWETHANMGQAATLNKGWRMSRGSILSYLSADDVLEPNAVSRSLACLNSHPDAVLSYCDYHTIAEDSRLVRRIRTPEFRYRDMLVRGVCHPGPAAFFRRWAFDKAGPWNTIYRQMPDYDFYLRLALVGNFQRIAEPLARYRVHAESQTYAKSSFKRSMEPVHIVSAYFRRQRVPAAVAGTDASALSNAYLKSANLNWRAGRYSVSLKLAARALQIWPRCMLAPRTARVVAHAMLSRLRHTAQRFICSRMPTGKPTAHGQICTFL